MVGSLALTQMRPAVAGAQLQGAGATFPYPLYSKWFSDFQKKYPDVQINYQSIGSGGGINQLLKGTVDFGASDAPMTNEELAKASTPVVHIPTVLGAVVLSANLPGVKAVLKLTPEVIADIFLGKIQKWNDSKIAALNGGVTLPAMAILPVYRADGSGTTSIFTDYLVKVSPEFKASVGSGKSVKWPAGLGGKGNEGVTGVIKQTPGAIGYVELIYAESNKLEVAQIKNPSGQYVTPSLESVTAAAQGALKSIPADYRVSITNASGKKAYPISGFTYLLVPARGKAPKQQFIKDLLLWAVTEGQKTAPSLSYAPLPQELARKVQKSIQELKVE
ncbi:phosphate ABC transporter substrate-binding protein PstS [bacterium]|nr:phosphate ABC transporter substrate-binding protein PstS [bacterium]